MYGVSGIPHSQWEGYMDDVGGGTTYPRYLAHYNQIIATDAPMEIAPAMNIVGRSLEVSGDVLMTGDLTSTNNKFVCILTYDFTGSQDPDYFASVIAYEDVNFDLTTTGETGTYSAVFDYDDSWDLAKLTAVVMVQTFSGNNEIFQAGSTTFTGLLPMFSSNIQVGPPSLAVQFTSFSFPQEGIVSWEWDLDGDGEYDSTEENPFMFYETPGIYDVTLRISDGTEYAEATYDDFITVTDGSDISGELSGIWTETGTYNITDDVLISEGNELIIQPGTMITLENNSQFIVNGLLQAIGRDEETIGFSSETQWKGFKFEGTDADNILHNCHISNANYSAMMIIDAKIDLINNKIFDNTGTSYGAALDISNSDDVIIHNNVFANNYNNGLVGVIALSNSIPTFTNNIIVNNDGTTGGIISLKNSADLVILNNTFANNASNSGKFFIFNSNPNIKNCIISETGEIFNLINGTPVVVYTCITGGYGGLGNIDADPMFNSPSEGDGNNYNGLDAYWYLQENSPCVDAGHPSGAYSDVEDPQNPGYALFPAMGTTTNDMGAFGGDGFADYVGIEEEIEIENMIYRSRIDVFPNPFNSSISMNITSQELNKPISLGVYNVKGQLVKSIVENEILTSRSQFNWDGKDSFGRSTASGIYFVKMKTDSSETMKKVMLIK